MAPDPPNEKRSPLHEAANTAFKDEDYLAAIGLYNSLLRNGDPSSPTILCNRSLAYLKIGMYKLALKDVDEVLRLHPTSDKAIAGKIQSLQGLQRYEEALSSLQSKVSPDNLKLPYYQSLLTKSKELIKQSKGDLLKLEKTEKHEIGQFTGPIKIVSVAGKGRGVNATQDIVPGQLLLVSKAFAMVYGAHSDLLQDLLVAKIVIAKLTMPDEETRKQFGNLSFRKTPHYKLPSSFDWKNSENLQEMEPLLRGAEMTICFITTTSHHPQSGFGFLKQLI